MCCGVGTAVLNNSLSLWTLEHNRTGADVLHKNKPQAHPAPALCFCFRSRSPFCRLFFITVVAFNFLQFNSVFCPFQGKKKKKKTYQQAPLFLLFSSSAIPSRGCETLVLFPSPSYLGGLSGTLPVILSPFLWAVIWQQGRLKK